MAMRILLITTLLGILAGCSSSNKGSSHPISNKAPKPVPKQTYNDELLEEEKGDQWQHREIPYHRNPIRERPSPRMTGPNRAPFPPN